MTNQIQAGDRVRDPLDAPDSPRRTVQRVSRDGKTVYMTDGGEMAAEECTDVLLPGESETYEPPKKTIDIGGVIVESPDIEATVKAAEATKPLDEALGKHAEVKAAERKMETDPRPVYKGWSYPQLKAAFDKVADPDDWRGPIELRCGGEAVQAIVAAIEFFTATEPEVTYNPAAKMGITPFVIRSEGYRAGPAGDR